MGYISLIMLATIIMAVGYGYLRSGIEVNEGEEVKRTKLNDRGELTEMIEVS